MHANQIHCGRGVKIPKVVLDTAPARVYGKGRAYSVRPPADARLPANPRGVPPC